MHSRHSPVERARHAHFKARADSNGEPSTFQGGLDSLDQEIAAALGIQSGPVQNVAQDPTSSSVSQKVASSTSSQPVKAATTISTSSSSSRFTTSTSSSLSSKSSLSSSVDPHSSLSSSSSVVPQIATSSSPSPSPSPSATSSSTFPYTAYIPSQSAQNDDATGASKGTSAGAIGAVIAVVLLVILAIVLFFVRRSYIRRRQQRRNTWGAGLYPKYQEDADQFNEKMDSAPPVPSKSETVSEISMPVASNNLTGSSFGANLSANITPPSMTYNNPVNETYQNVSMASTVPGANTESAASKANGQGEIAFVKCLFVPTLPDELSITAGEAVHLLTAYDDGWALCANGRGEQGMVPLECLSRDASGVTVSGLLPSDSTATDGKASKRMSSIYPSN